MESSAPTPGDEAEDLAPPGPRPLLIGLGLILLTLLTFLPALDCGFVNYDDPVYVTQNPYVRSGVTLDGIRWVLRSFVSSNYHPVTVFSHMLDVELFGLNPRGHHLMSLLFHLANTVLLFEILRRATAESGGVAEVWASAFVAALFAVHPLRVETVVWISDRKDLISTFFLLLAVAAYLAWCRRRSALRYLWIVLAAVLSLLSKATAVILPCILLLLDLWPLGRIPRTSFREALLALRRLLLEKLPLFALSILAGALAVVAQSQAWVSAQSLSFAHRISNAAVAYVKYILKTLWPHDLAVFYPQVPIPVSQAVGAALLLGAWTLFALWQWRRHPYLAVGWLWFLGVLFPLIGVTQVGNQAMADRYSYVAGVGLLIMLAWGGHALRAKLALPPRLLAATALVIVLALPWPTRAQIAVWQSSETLFRHALEVTPPNVVAHLNLAEGLRTAGRPEASLEHFLAALSLEPTRVEAHAGLGMALMALGRPEEAASALGKALELAPGDLRLYQALAVVLDGAGRTQEAIEQLRKAVALHPGFLAAHLGLAELLQKVGDPEGAQIHLRKAMELDPRLSK